MTIIEPTIDLETVSAVPTADSVVRTPGMVGKILRKPGALFGLVMLGTICVALLFAPAIARFDPTAVDPPLRLAPSSWVHPLGTDLLGRDVLTRLLYGGRTSVFAALCATGAITSLGLVLGTCAGFLGGVVDTAIMRIADVLQALPLLVIAMVTIGLLGGGIAALVLAVALLGWPVAARVVRAAALSIREQGFVAAAQACGASRLRITFRHLAPAVVNTVTTLTLVELGRVILVLASLSFLGFGVRPPNPEWGAMLADARSSFFLAPRLLIYPGLAISLLVISVNLIGDGVRDAIGAPV